MFNIGYCLYLRKKTSPDIGALLVGFPIATINTLPLYNNQSLVVDLNLK